MSLVIWSIWSISLLSKWHVIVVLFRFKAIEEHHEEVKAMVEQYMSSVQSLASTDALLEALTPDAAPMASTPSTSTSGSASGNKAPSLAQVGSASDSNLTYHREAGGPIPSPSALFARTFSYAMPNKGPAKPSTWSL